MRITFLLTSFFIGSLLLIGHRAAGASSVRSTVRVSGSTGSTVTETTTAGTARVKVDVENRVNGQLIDPVHLDLKGEEVRQGVDIQRRSTTNTGTGGTAEVKTNVQVRGNAAGAGESSVRSGSQIKNNRAERVKTVRPRAGAEERKTDVRERRRSLAARMGEAFRSLWNSIEQLVL